ncbi:MAG: NAD(+) diphosphatase [Ardenticatenaceae bacterium]|nr:NAD(+) diphosphatase [Ardenticatenaceae bacterium]
MDAEQRFVRTVRLPDGRFDNALWFAFRGRDLVLRRVGETLVVPAGPSLAAAGFPQGRAVSIGTLDGAPVFAVDLPPDAPLAPGFEAYGLRTLYGPLDDLTWRLAAYAAEVEHWTRTSRFCPQCGDPTEAEPADWGRRCTACGSVHYPRVSPCVIVLIHDGPRVLMVRQPHFPRGMYGLVAGFVEPGESLEECLRREVAEEVAIEVDDICYFGSQPWPFPHQLMVGFMARYAGGSVRMNDGELEHASWFHVDSLPGLPPRVSIARKLVEAFVVQSRP